MVGRPDGGEMSILQREKHSIISLVGKQEKGTAMVEFRMLHPW